VRFLLDMGVSPEVAAWLRGQGHDAHHLREQGLHRLDDPDIFAKAVAEGRVLLTCDLDFAEIVALSGNRTVSVVLFRLASMRPHRVIERLSRVLMESSPALSAGAVVVVEEARHRVRRLPIEG
jgi:predicted nuclease of predicted toxin-antitoxin system